MGRTSERFEVTNGMHQGGVLSFVLFAVYFEFARFAVLLIGEIISVKHCVMQMI